MIKNGDVSRSRNNRSWLQKFFKNTSREQKYAFYGISSLCLIMLLILVVKFIVFPDQPSICTTPTCVKSATDLLSHIDNKVDPCDDFYRFACGNFLRNCNLDERGFHSVENVMGEQIQEEIRDMLEEPIQPGDPSAFNLAKKFYRACTNESAIEAEGLKGTQEIFKQIGGWPTLEEDFQENQFDWKRAVHKLRNMGINFDFFFSVAVDVDKKDPDRYILAIRDPYYSPSEIKQNVKAMFLEYMVDLAIQFGAKPARAISDQEDVLALLLKLAKISEEVSNYNQSDTYNPYTLSELRYAFPSIPWLDYFNEILAPGASIGYDDIIIVEHPVYLKKLENLLLTTPNRILANFMAWHTLQLLINYLPAKVLDKAYDYLRKVNGRIIRKPRWHACVKATEDRLNSAISVAYVEHYFDDMKRLKVDTLMRQIKGQFRMTLWKVDWLDRDTKKKALETVEQSKMETVTYTELMEVLEENRIYEKVDIEENKLLSAALNLDEVRLNLYYGKLRKTPSDNWLKHPGFTTGLKIVYLPKENILKFPVGLFRPMYYQTDRPEYLNYGGLGTLIAHEISHVFIEAETDQLPGMSRSWWSTESISNYAEKLRCLSNQYRKFVIAELNQHLNSKNTQDEDMADLAGMKIAYRAYTEWTYEHNPEPFLPGLPYTPKQLFWISAAVRHCAKYDPKTLQIFLTSYKQSPQRFRVNGPLQNLDEFSRDFGCYRGSQMNAEKKCYIW